MPGFAIVHLINVYNKILYVLGMVDLMIARKNKLWKGKVSNNGKQGIKLHDKERKSLKCI